MISVGHSRARSASTFGATLTASGGRTSSFYRGNAGQKVPLRGFLKGAQTSSLKSCRRTTGGRRYDERSMLVLKGVEEGALLDSNDIRWLQVPRLAGNAMAATSSGQDRRRSPL